MGEMIKYEIYGTGMEFIVGSVADEKAKKIMKFSAKKSVDAAFEMAFKYPAYECDNVFHYYGPCMDDLSDSETIESEDGDRIDVKSILAENEDAIYDDLMDMFDINKAEKAVIEKSKQNFMIKIRGCFERFKPKKTPDTKFLFVQEYLEKGTWGFLELDAGIDENDCVMVGCEIIIQNISCSFLIGCAIINRKAQTIDFIEIESGADTVGKTKNYRLVDNKDNEVWSSY